MKIILELTNSESAKGTMRSAFEKDKDALHLFGENGEIDFQIKMETLLIEDILTIKRIEDLDEIRIWYSSLNSNDSIYMAFSLHRLADYIDKIKLIDVAKYNGRHSIMRVCLGSYNREEIIEWQKLECAATQDDMEFARKLLACYFSQKEESNSFIMVKGHQIYELPYEEIKDYICSHFENFKLASHTIGTVLSKEWNEKGWFFADNVIYKFICDLINEGRIMVQASYHERYNVPPKLFLKP